MLIKDFEFTLKDGRTAIILDGKKNVITCKNDTSGADVGLT